MSERSGELTLGCMPCTETVTVGGDYEELSTAMERFESDYGVNIPWVVSDDGGGHMNDNGLGLCPNSGEPCPYKVDIDLAADDLLVQEFELLDGPGERSKEMQEYLNPSRLTYGRYPWQRKSIL